MRSLFTLLLSVTLTLPLLAQTTKRSLTPDDYDRWESVRSEKISNDGRWIAYQIDPQDGNGRLEVATAGKLRYTFPRGHMAQFTPDNRFLVMRLKVPVEDIRKAKLKKKKADEMPKDSLLVLNLTTGETTKLPNAKSFMFGKESGSWLAILQEANAPKLVADAGSSAKKDTLTPTPATSTTTVATKKGSTKKIKGDDLTLLNMADGTRKTVRYVSNVVVSDNGQTIFYSRESALDSVAAKAKPIPGVSLFNTKTGQTMLVDSGSARKIYKGLAVDKTGQQLAWMTSPDSVGADVRVFSLYYKTLNSAATAKAKRGKSAPALQPYRVPGR